MLYEVITSISMHFALDIEAEMHHVAVLDHIFLALQAQQTFLLGARLAAGGVV